MFNITKFMHPNLYRMIFVTVFIKAVTTLLLGAADQAVMPLNPNTLSNMTPRGMVCIGSGWNAAQFGNLKIIPAP